MRSLLYRQAPSVDLLRLVRLLRSFFDGPVSATASAVVLWTIREACSPGESVGAAGVAERAEDLADLRFAD